MLILDSIYSYSYKTIYDNEWTCFIKEQLQTITNIKRTSNS